MPLDILVSTDSVSFVRNSLPSIVNLSNSFLLIIYSSTEILPSLLCLCWSLQVELTTSFLVFPKHHVYNFHYVTYLMIIYDQFQVCLHYGKIVLFKCVSPTVSSVFSIKVNVCLKKERKRINEFMKVPSCWYTSITDNASMWIQLTALIAWKPTSFHPIGFW